jgi:hypothetical protein
MKNKPLKSLAPFLPFFDKSIKILPLFYQPLKIFLQPFYDFRLKFWPSGEKGCRQERKKSAKTLCSPASPFSIVTCTFK